MFLIYEDDDDIIGVTSRQRAVNKPLEQRNLEEVIYEWGNKVGNLLFCDKTRQGPRGFDETTWMASGDGLTGGG